MKWFFLLLLRFKNQGYKKLFSQILFVYFVSLDKNQPTYCFSYRQTKPIQFFFKKIQINKWSF